MRTELSDEERQDARAYVDAVVAAAEGVGEVQAPQQDLELTNRPLLTRLVPGFVKRAVVRTLRYVLRHPFEHLAHPLQIRLEQEIGEIRGTARSALRRAEQNASELERLRKELERRSREPRT